MSGGRNKPGHGYTYAAAIIIAGIILLLPIVPALLARHQIEKNYNSVEIAADYYQLLEVAQTYNIKLDPFLKDVKSSGVEAIAILEDTPHNLEMRGLCNVIRGNDWIGFYTEAQKKEIKALNGVEPKKWDQSGIDMSLLRDLDPSMTHLLFTDSELGRKVGQAAVLRYGSRASLTGPDGLITVSLSGEPDLIFETGLGFNTSDATRISSLGFRIIPRVRNERFYSAEVIREIMGEALDIAGDGTTMIFEGDEVLGYPSHLKEVSSSLTEANDNFGWVEFSKQFGEKSIAGSIPDRTVRVHSIEDKEMEVYTPSKGITRFTRAVRERGCRLVYLKPFRYPVGPDNIAKTLDYFNAVHDGITAEGMTIGRPSLFSGDNGVWKEPAKGWTTYILSLYLFFVFVYLLGDKIINRWKWVGILPIIATLGVIFMVMVLKDSSSTNLTGKLLALLAAVLMPVLGLSEVVRHLISDNRKIGIIRGAALWLMAIGLAFIGGLIAASLLSTRYYMLQIDSFSGVKLSLMLPILAAIVLGVRLVIPKELREKGIITHIQYLLEYQLQVKHVVAFLILAAAGLLILMRSGNEPLIGVGEFESGLRAKMEVFFYARPRTKEFLIGYPLLLAGILWYLKGRNVLGYLGIVGGAVGLASVVNTFCHIHIPISLSLLRTFWGIILGFIIGLIYYAIVELVLWGYRRINLKEKHVDEKSI